MCFKTKIMSRPKTKETEIKARCSERIKENLSRKLIYCGLTYSYGGEVRPGFSEFLELLADKPLDWFEENFKKGLDKQE